MKNTRYGRADGVEPLLIRRNFHGTRPSHFKISEDFRLYLNLYDDRPNRSLLRITDAGDEEEVVRFRDEEVVVRLPEVQEFINTKQMYLAICFDYTRLAKHALPQIGLTAEDRVYSAADHSYRLSLVDVADRGWGNGAKAMSRLSGKKLLRPKARQNGRLPVATERAWGTEEFIIGIDQ